MARPEEKHFHLGVCQFGIPTHNRILDIYHQKIKPLEDGLVGVKSEMALLMRHTSMLVRKQIFDMKTDMARNKLWEQTTRPQWVKVL
jgi:hypothetical protein